MVLSEVGQSENVAGVPSQAASQNLENKKEINHALRCTQGALIEAVNYRVPEVVPQIVAHLNSLKRNPTNAKSILEDCKGTFKYARNSHPATGDAAPIINLEKETRNALPEVRHLILEMAHPTITCRRSNYENIGICESTTGGRWMTQGPDAGNPALAEKIGNGRWVSVKSHLLTRVKLLLGDKYALEKILFPQP